MFRFITKSLISNYHNVCKIQESSIKFLCFLQTLAVESNNSKSCNPRNQHHPTVSYLVNKCGLPLHSAILASKKLSTIKNTQKPDSVLQLFKSYGFTQTQITTLITKYPSYIQYDSIKTLKPKFEFYESLGLSKPDLAKLLSSDSNLLKSSLQDKVIPTVDFLKSILKTNEALIRTLKRWPSIVGTDYRIKMEPNLLALRAHGVPDLNIRKFLMMYPRSFKLQNEVFRDKIKRVEKLGIDPKSPGYLLSLRMMLSLSDSLWAKKIDVYKSFGWSDGDVLAVFRKQPNFISTSEKKVRLLMDFYLNKLGLNPYDVVKSPKLLMLSLEKRIILRCSVLQVLLSKGVFSELHLVWALTMTKAKFEMLFVTKYQEVVPEIVSVYQGEKGFPRVGAMHMIPLGLSAKKKKYDTIGFVSAEKPKVVSSNNGL